MGSALDEAERALVTGSWSKASDAAATARRVARTAPDRVAAECVWVQAEYKLGRLGETHEGDARRVTGVGGDPLEPQTLLLWSRLTLADAPRARPETNEDDPKARRAEASAADALAGVFREAFRRRQRCATETHQPSASTVRRDAIDQSSDGSSDDKSSDDEATATAAAWLYCVDVLCARRRDPNAAAEWLRANYASLASPAREKLADVVSAAAAKDQHEKASSSSTTTTDAEARKSRGTVTARRSVSNEASSSEEASAVFVAKDEETTRKRGSSFSRRTTNSLRATLDAGLGSIVDTVNESFGVSLDSKDTATRLGAAAAAVAAVAVAYAVVAEATRNQTRRAQRR
jgi:hypothetical protein